MARTNKFSDAILALLLACLALFLCTSRPSTHRPYRRDLGASTASTAATVTHTAAATLSATAHTARISCAVLSPWDDTHFSHDQDWVILADGRRVQPNTLWKWVAHDSSTGHLRNKATGGHLNFRPGGFVRGHGNRLPRQPAREGPSTLLERTQFEYDRFMVDSQPCTAALTMLLRFRKGAAYVHVLQDGSLGAQLGKCAGNAECAFAWEPQPQVGRDWAVVRSRLTGRLLRMVDDSHMAFSSWDGILAPHAHRKSSGARLAMTRSGDRSGNVDGGRGSGDGGGGGGGSGGGGGNDSSSRRGASRGSGGCPLQPLARPPPGWHFNTTRHAASIAAALAPWYDGNLSASSVDMIYWRDMYPYANRAELPSIHLAVQGGALFYKQRRNAHARARSGDGVPPADSADAQLLTMLTQIAQVVALPDAEVVAHAGSLPKVPAQNPELVLSPVADAAHSDVVVPSPWLWAALTATATAPICGALDTRKAQLLVLSECEASTEEGPLRRFYATRRALAHARRHPRLLRVVLSHACIHGGSGGGGAGAARRLPMDEARSRLASGVGEDTPAPGSNGLGEAAADHAAALACSHRWLLVIEGSGPPHELVSRMRQGFVIFKQASPYREHPHSQLLAWTHFVPVAANLVDLPRRASWANRHPSAAEAIARNAQELAASLHAYDVACYSWQLLSAISRLQNFEPRTSSFLGFVPAQQRRAHRSVRGGGAD